jgi:hypothetical protein
MAKTDRYVESLGAGVRTGNYTRTLLRKLEERAETQHSAQLTIMKFNTNWRVAFFIPQNHFEVAEMPEGKSFEHAAEAALSKHMHWHNAIGERAKVKEEAIRSRGINLIFDMAEEAKAKAKATDRT